MAIDATEDDISGHKGRSCFVAGHVGIDRRDIGAKTYLACCSGYDLDLGCADVSNVRAISPGRCRGRNDVVVDKRQTSHAEPRELLGHGRPGSAHSNHGYVHLCQTLLAQAPEDAHLSVEAG